MAPSIRWVTAVSPDPDRLRNLRDVLKTIAADPRHNPLLPFAELPMLHFASFTLFMVKPTPLLIFESNLDGRIDRYISQLVSVGREGLDAVYRACPGYPHSGDNTAVERYFENLKHGPQLYHIGHPDRSVQEIRGDHELRRSIEREFAADPRLQRRSPSDIVREIRRRANCPSGLWSWRRPWHADWNQDPGGPPTPLDQIAWKPDNWPWLGWLRHFLILVSIAWLVAAALVIVGSALTIPRNQIIVVETLLVFAAVRFGSGDASFGRSVIIAGAFGGLVYLPFLRAPFAEFSTRPPVLIGSALILILPAVLLISFLWLLWRLMIEDRRWIPLDEATKARVRTLLEAEDRPEHSHYNHVAGLSELWPDFRRLRCARTWLVLKLLNLFYRTQYVKGRLVTIPSIHFAQWSLVNGRYLLFVTNYDGPADSYLDDFFNSLALGVAFIWHDTQPFPMTIDPRRLKVWVRKGQTEASVRYRAAVYDGLTVGAINSNTYIRNRLLRGRGDASARRWLRRFATIPEEPTVLSRLSGWMKERAGIGG